MTDPLSVVLSPERRAEIQRCYDETWPNHRDLFWPLVAVRDLLASEAALRAELEQANQRVERLRMALIGEPLPNEKRVLLTDDLSERQP
jgi:hypothetical protein